MVWRNEGKVDRGLRVVVGLAVLSLALAGSESVWVGAGLVPLVTGLVDSCPLYSILDINTCDFRRETA